MNLRNILVPVGVLVLLGVSYTTYGLPGVVAVFGGLVMWALLHFTRLMSVMRKTANRPIGYVGSAVMLNARLRKGVNLMHVVAMTQALGEQLSEPNAQPEVYRWTDGTQSHVTCEFVHGKLASWWLVRPEVESLSAAEAETSIAP
jgi:hypothetical protein